MELRKIKLMKRNKKGQFESALLTIILIVVIGIILFFFNHVNDKLYTSFDKYFNDSEDYNNSEAHQTLQKVHEVDNSVWDWVFLAMFIGMVILMIMLSFASKINVSFFWLFILLGLVIMVVGVVLSNIWQEMVEKGEFADTLLRFPITNALLGAYFPTLIVVVLFIIIIIIFGKPPVEVKE